MAGDGGNFPASKHNEATSHLTQYRDSGSNIKTGDQVETKYKSYQLIINYRAHTLGLHWDNEKGTNIITDGDKKVFKSYLVGTFGTDIAKNRLKKKFIASLQNNGWQYWPHFQTIQPNASTKGKNTFQPSLSSSNIGKPQPPMSINKVNPSSPAVTPLSSDAMSVNPIPSTPAIANKRPFNTINLDSDSETGTEGDHFAPSSTLIGSKTTIFSSSAKKVFELHRSSTAHLSSPISEVSHGLKPSSIISKPPTSQSQKLLAAGLSRNIKLNMMKDLGHTLVAVKDSLLVSPEELASKLRHEATSIVMRDTYLSMKKQLHIVMLICQDISYAESLMGMLNAGLDNDSMETDALHAYYDEISKDCDV